MRFQSVIWHEQEHSERRLHIGSRLQGCCEPSAIPRRAALNWGGSRGAAAEPCAIRPVAQSLEPAAHNGLVGGSSPPGPSGAMPPTQRPLRLEAAILSRMRSEVTSRSNWANDSSTFSVSRPIEVVVLNCWVTDTKDTLCRSNNSTSLAKSASDRVRRSTL